jgi:hypothetical protein
MGVFPDSDEALDRKVAKAERALPSQSSKCLQTSHQQTLHVCMSTFLPGIAKEKGAKDDEREEGEEQRADLRWALNVLVAMMGPWKKKVEVLAWALQQPQVHFGSRSRVSAGRVDPAQPHKGY